MSTDHQIVAKYGEVANLIPIRNDQALPIVKARDLWSYLESGKRFADWVAKRLDNLGAVEGEDFFTEQRKSGGRPSTEYFVTIDMAKHMAMVEKTEKGHEVRSYFIAAEKQLKQLSGDALDKPRDELTLLLQAALEERQRVLAIEERQTANEEETRQLKAKVEAISGGSGYFTVRGYANLNGVKIPTVVAAQIGRKAGKLARERGFVMRQAIDELYGAVNSYPEEILEAVFEEMGL